MRTLESCGPGAFDLPVSDSVAADDRLEWLAEDGRGRAEPGLVGELTGEVILDRRED